MLSSWLLSELKCGIVTSLLASYSDSIDVAGVSGEGLLAGAFPHVPQLGQRVAGSGDEGVHVGGQSQGHAVSNVVGEDHLLLACLQIPQAADGTRGRITVREDIDTFFFKSRVFIERWF